MRNKIFLTLILSLLLSCPVLAQEPIKAQVDKLKLSTDEVLTYKLTITASETDMGNPQLPKFTGFNILSQSQSTTLAMEKGGWKTSLLYEFILSPAGAGKLKIEPASIKTKGRLYSTEAFEIEVTQGKAMPKTPLPPESEELKTTL